MSDLSPFYPLSGREVICGVSYEWDFINRSLGALHYSENGEPIKTVHLKETNEDFKHYLRTRAYESAQNGEAVSAAVIKEIEEALGRALGDHDAQAYAKAWHYLHAKGNVFLTFCARLVFDYHALDRELTQTALLSITRARYSSPSSALLHLDCTGASGAGKNDLVSRIHTLIPSNYALYYSTVSPTALQYKTIKRTKDDKGRVRISVDKDAFKGKIVIISEVADAAGFSALKALAETEEGAEFTHMATVNGEAIEMTITGPRCVIITSVEGVNDEQVKRRFIHGSVSEDTQENKELKLALIETLLLERKDIEDDERLKVARAGIDLIFSTEYVVFEPLEFEVRALIKELDALFLEAGYGITSIKQFFTLCECLALWKRYSRGHTRIDAEDVQEAWFLLSTFERETITRTSRQGIATLRAIKALCDECDNKFELDPGRFGETPGRPTRREVVKASNVPQAQVYRLLRNRQDDKGKLGELIELGYVRDCESNGQNAVELTQLGLTVLGEVPNFVLINGYEYEPQEPILKDDIIDFDQGDYHDYQELSGLDNHGLEK